MTGSRSKVSYGKDLRKEAKAGSLGLVTVSILHPNGEVVEAQGTATPEQCMFAKWVAAMLFSEEVKDLPDVQAFVRDALMESTVEQQVTKL